MSQFHLRRPGLILACLIGLALAVAACGAEYTPPQISEIVVAPRVVRAGEQATLTAIVTAPEGSRWRYTWSATLGKIVAGSDGRTATYTAPAYAGTDQITLTVNDGQTTTTQTVSIVIERVITVVTPIPLDTPTPSSTPSPTPTSTRPLHTPTPTTTLQMSPTLTQATPTATRPVASPTPTPTSTPRPPVPMPTPTQTPVVKIIQPRNGDTVPYGAVITGTFANLPTGQTIWVLVQPRGEPNYHPQPPVITSREGQWQTITYLGPADPKQIVTEAYDVFAVLADEKASSIFRAYLEDAARSGKYPGFAQLPAGVTIHDKIMLKRK